MKTANPYLYFSGNTEEAFAFYGSVFGGEPIGMLRYRDFADNPMGVPDAELDRIAHIALPLGKDNVLMGTDTLESRGQSLTFGNNFYLTLEAESGEEAERTFGALSEGGRVEMPLQRTDWAEQYGICTDRFGVQWMMSYTGDAQLSAGPSA